jgi:hypothetical protein
MSEQEVLTHLQEVVKLYRRDFSALKQWRQAYQQLKKSSDENLRKITELEAENQRLRNVSAQETGEYEEQPAVVLDDFNKWAANPVPALPSGFSYIEGEFRIRTKNVYTASSSSESKWIVNIKGDKKYLLPNPLSFNQLTNIKELYLMDMSRLRPSNNKIKIAKPCELLDECFINYPGELTIL